MSDDPRATPAAAASRADVAVVRREARETVLAELEAIATAVEGDPLTQGRDAAETIRWAVNCVRDGVTVKPWAELSEPPAAAEGAGDERTLRLLCAEMVQVIEGRPPRDPFAIVDDMRVVLARPAPAAEGRRYGTFHELSVDGAIVRLERAVRDQEGDGWPTVRATDLFLVLSVVKDLAARLAPATEGEP